MESIQNKPSPVGEGGPLAVDEELNGDLFTLQLLAHIIPLKWSKKWPKFQQTE